MYIYVYLYIFLNCDCMFIQTYLHVLFHLLIFYSVGETLRLNTRDHVPNGEIPRYTR